MERYKSRVPKNRRIGKHKRTHAVVPVTPPALSLPQVASATLLLDLRASQLALSDGDPVSTWPDASGNHRDFTQTGDARPDYVANSGGGPAVYFGGFGHDPIQYMSCPMFGNGLLCLAVFSIGKFDSSVADDSGFLSNWDENQFGWEANRDWIIEEGDRASLFISGNLGSWFARKSEASLGAYAVCEAEMLDALTNTGHAFINGSNLSETISGAVAGSTVSTSSDVLLGANHYFLPSTGFSGWLKNVLMYQINDVTAWQSTDRAAIEAWLATNP